MADTRNLILGPAQVYIGTFGAVVEPGATSGDFSGSSWTPTSGWTDLGFTNGGVTLNLQKEYTPLEVDQITSTPHSVVTSESYEVTTSLAEGTLENLVLAMNDGVIDTSTPGVKKYKPVDSVAGRPTGYKALLLVGTGTAADLSVGARRRFVLVRKVLSTAGISVAYSKTDQQVFEVTFTGHYVSSAVRPYEIMDPA